jgi:hypothetical protein
MQEGGRSVPVLVLDLEHCGPGDHQVTAHVPYTDATVGQAEAIAKRLRRGAPITVSTQLTGTRWILPAASLSTTQPQEG